MFHIDNVDSTWKLGQAKPQSSRTNVAKKMTYYTDKKHLSLGTELKAFSVLHKAPFVGSKNSLEDLFKAKDGTDSGVIIVTYQQITIFMTVLLFLVVYCLVVNATGESERSVHSYL